MQQSLEKGARPYIPENERSAMLNVNNFRSQDQPEALTHSLRFEAYELPKPPPLVTRTPASLTSSTDLVQVPEPTFAKESHQAPLPSSIPDTAPGEHGVKLRLEGVQKKWGRPTYASPSAPSASTSGVQKTTNGLTYGPETTSSQIRAVSYDSKKQHVEVSAEKQKLAASLFGGSSRNEKRPTSSQKAVRSRPTSAEKVRAAAANTATEVTAEKTAPPPQVQPPPDLLDLGEPTSESVPSVDPFMQLEGLLGPTQVTTSESTVAATASKPTDLMEALYAEMPSTGPSGIDMFSSSIKSGVPTNANKSSQTVVQTTSTKKGPNIRDSLQKDAVARQVGVTPTGQNPNLFSDLLG